MRKFKKFGVVLILAGSLLIAWALVRLLLTTDAPASMGVEYAAAAAPDAAKSLEKLEENMGDLLVSATVEAVQHNCVVSGPSGTAVVTLRAVHSGYPQTCPRYLESGRWLDGEEISQAGESVVLDEDMVYALFGSEDCIGQKVTIGSGEYRVTGTARHHRSVAEIEEFSAYIPILTASKADLVMDYYVMHAVVLSGAERTFESEMKKLWEKGEYYELRKEVRRVLFLPRTVLIAAMLAVLVRLFGWLKGFLRGNVRKIREYSRRMYPRQYFLKATIRIAAMLAVSALWLGTLYAISQFAIDPVYTFTEWVPESLVEAEKIQKVFWNLVNAAAGNVRIQTENMMKIRFYGGMVRWGVLLILLSAVFCRSREEFRFTNFRGQARGDELSHK